MPSGFAFRRENLAKSITTSLMGGEFPNPDFGSGLFLSAPRRTGKSTFLREDLVPALKERGITTVYVDLWADRDKDPSLLIADAIKRALRDVEGVVTKAARATGLNKIGVAGAISFDIDRIGEVDGTTLTGALGALIERTGKPVALLVDEAQHALTSDRGLNAMFALKAARDSLNQRGEKRNLILVFTGSHRDKLANLILKRDQPFYGAQLTDFPLLGKDYTDAYTDWVNERLASDNQFAQEDVFAAFDVLGRRPEMLQNVIRDIALSQAKSADLKAGLNNGAALFRNRVWDDFDREFFSLTKNQRAVLTHLIQKGDEFSPFTEESLAAYTKMTGEPVDAAAAQAALSALREKNMVWRSSRGSYVLDDQSMSLWFEHRNKIDNSADQSVHIPQVS